MAYIEHTNLNAPNFVELHNSQQHVPQEFTDTNIVRELTPSEQAINEVLDLSNQFSGWTTTLNNVAKSISEVNFYPYEGEWNQGVELAAASMLTQWEKLSKSITSIVEFHDLMAHKYIKVLEEVQPKESVINLAEKNA